MGFKLPWSNFHELNLDWMLTKMKELEQAVADIQASATPSTSVPQMDGIGAVGTESNFARGDHVHPTDTSRASASALADLDSREYNDYTTLNAELNTVDAKIAFSSAAPQVDGVASPGSSPYQARADHVHPTDTSRASKSEFDTLKSTVDSMDRAASPYDALPAMDGTASAGVIGAYSRGDHVHPHDTTKFDKTGGDVTGAVLIESENRFITRSAIGWLRIATIPNEPGVKAIFTINRKGAATPSETHTITLTINNTRGVTFTDENSISDVSYINKIRYTDAGAVDINVDQAYESLIGIHLQKFGITKAVNNAMSLITPTDVDETPDGEVIVTAYDLVANTTETISAYAAGKYWYFKRNGKIITLMAPSNVGVDMTAGSVNIISLSAGWRPERTVQFPIANNAATYTGAYCEVNQYGTVRLYHNGMTNGDKCGITGTWIAE